jgi:hypothetical protein
MSEPPDPHEFRVRMHRIMAGRHRVATAEHEMAAAALKAEKSLRAFAEAWNEGAAKDVAEHPDLAELNVHLDGFYDAGPAHPGEEPTT